MTKTATVHIVDDDAGLRRSLGELLKGEGHTVALYETAQAFLKTEHDFRPGCIILDLRLPGMSGMEMHSALLDRANHLPILFLTGHGKVHTAVEAIKRGAIDFLEKPVDNDVLVAKVRDAVNKSIPLMRRAEALSKLTAREHEFIPFLERKTPNKEIAHDLGISEKTVEFHKRNILEKLHKYEIRAIICTNFTKY